MDSNCKTNSVSLVQPVIQLLVHQLVLLLDSIPKDLPVFLVNLQLQLVMLLAVLKDSIPLETLVLNALLELSPVPLPFYTNLAIMDST
jgi:hypothetical protein